MAVKRRSTRATTRRISGAGKSATPSSGGVLRNATGDDLVERFRAFVLNDPDVQDDLRNVRTATGVTRLAKKHGFTLSEREVRAAARAAGGGLTVDGLGGLIGGAPCWCNKSVVNSKSCK
jgi:hypothetical protein